MSDNDRSPRGADDVPAAEEPNGNGKAVVDSPKDRSRSRSRSKSRSRSPVRSPTRSHSPVRRRSKSKSPVRRRSGSPKRRSPSPRRRSPSPRRRSVSPRRRSRSPAKRRSRSRSPRRDRRRDSRSRSRDRRRRSPSRSRSRGRRSSRSPNARYGLPPRGRTPPRVGTQLFVAGLNFITNERELERKFGRYGRVREARIVRHPHTGESRGFGFVVMEDEVGCKEAIRDLDGQDWNGRRLLVEISRNPK